MRTLLLCAGLVACAIQSDGHFGCRCFCGLRDYTIRDGIGTVTPGSAKYVFSPEPIYLQPDLLHTLAHDPLLSKVGYFDEPERSRAREYFSVVAVKRDAILARSELILQRGLRAMQPAVQLRLADEVDAAVQQLYGNRAAGQSILRDLRTPQVATMRIARVNPDRAQAALADKAVCIKMCRDDVLLTPAAVKTFYMHDEYGVLKAAGFSPIHSVLTPEKPEWAAARLQIPGTALIPETESLRSWRAEMYARWQMLYVLASKFSLDFPSATRVSTDTCTGYRAEVQDLVKVDKPWSLNVTDHFDPLDVNPELGIANLRDALYLLPLGRSR